MDQDTDHERKGVIMARYEIRATCTREMTFEVEADSENDAIALLTEDQEYDEPPVEYDDLSVVEILSVKEIDETD